MNEKIPENHIMKNITALGLLLIGFSAFYYLVIFLPQQQHATLVQQQTAQQAETQNKTEMASELNNCLSKADSDYRTQESVAINFASGDCLKENGELACDTAVNANIKNLSQQLQTDKDNCFKQFPQN